MAKKVVAMIKLALQAGKANPAPPVGPALGQHGVNIMAFCKEYNARTQDKVGFVIPVEISVFEDRSFTFITKTHASAPGLVFRCTQLSTCFTLPGSYCIGSSFLILYMQFFICNMQDCPLLLAIPSLK